MITDAETLQQSVQTINSDSLIPCVMQTMIIKVSPVSIRYVSTEICKLRQGAMSAEQLPNQFCWPQCQDAETADNVSQRYRIK